MTHEDAAPVGQTVTNIPATSAVPAKSTPADGEQILFDAPAAETRQVHSTFGPQSIRGGYLSASSHARANLRKASNYAKRISRLSVICMTRQGHTSDLMRCREVLDRMTNAATFRAGYRSDEGVYGMARALISLSVADHMAEYILLRPENEPFSKSVDELEKNEAFIVDAIRGFLRDEKTATLLQDAWPGDTSHADVAAALLVSNISPVAHVIDDWNFGLDRNEALGRACAFTRDLALSMMDAIAPAQALPDARMFHFQTLSKAVAENYAAAWTREARAQKEHCNSLPAAERHAFIANQDAESARSSVERIEANTLEGIRQVFAAACALASEFKMTPAVIDQKFVQARNSMHDIARSQILFNSLLRQYGRLPSQEMPDGQDVRHMDEDFLQPDRQPFAPSARQSVASELTPAAIAVTSLENTSSSVTADASASTPAPISASAPASVSVQIPASHAAQTTAAAQPGEQRPAQVLTRDEIQGEKNQPQPGQAASASRLRLRPPGVKPV